MTIHEHKSKQNASKMSMCAGLDMSHRAKAYQLVRSFMTNIGTSSPVLCWFSTDLGFNTNLLYAGYV